MGPVDVAAPGIYLVLLHSTQRFKQYKQLQLKVFHVHINFRMLIVSTCEPLYGVL